MPSSLLGYSPVYDGENNIGTYFLNYKNETIDVTGGYFYEQFASGLIFRGWEDRQLGINNSLRGIRVNFTPTEYLDITGIYGQQRNGFEVSVGAIQGINAKADLSTAFKIETADIKMGVSDVGRYQSSGDNPEIPSTVNAYGGNIDFVFGNFFGDIEAILKDPEDRKSVV